MHTNSKPTRLILTLAVTIAVACTYLILTRSDYPHPLSSKSIDSTDSLKPKVKEPTAEIPQESLARLKSTYARNRTSPARIRIQATISDLSNQELPISQLLEEIADKNAPREYKLFLARTLRNSAKTGLSSEKREQVIESLYSIIDSTIEDQTFAAGIATTLVDVDDSTLTISKLSRLLSQLDEDNAAAATANAIARSSKAAAKSALLEFVLTESTSESPRTIALAESLAPLSHEQDIPINPIFHDIVSKTQDSALFIATLKALTNRDASESKSKTIAIARSRIPTFPQEIQPFLLDLTQPSRALHSAR